MYEIDTKTGGNDMTTHYRGIKVTPGSVKEKIAKVFSGIYRGNKNVAVKEKSTQSREGIYRGNKWVA
jgi:hypothetical protein